MKTSFNNVNITGIVSVPASGVIRLDDEVDKFVDAAQLERIKKTVGLCERRVAPAGITTLDLCEVAARELLKKMAPPTMPNALIFVTQTPDYFQPCNAAILHGKLGLPKDTIAFDVNLGCSGYVYGLYLAHLLIESGSANSVLLCAGDTLSRCAHERAVAPLFGDAGSATFIERSLTTKKAFFSLNTDGTGAETIKIPEGAFRNQQKDFSPNLMMDGADVFNFSLREVPNSIKEILSFSEVTSEDIDYFILHQANKYILQNIAKRCSIPTEKLPVDSLAKFGNTSSASIPLAMCSEISEKLARKGHRLLLAGFGVGLSWASAILEMDTLRVVGINEFSDKK